MIFFCVILLKIPSLGDDIAKILKNHPVAEAKSIIQVSKIDI